MEMQWTLESSYVYDEIDLSASHRRRDEKIYRYRIDAEVPTADTNRLFRTKESARESLAKAL